MGIKLLILYLLTWRVLLLGFVYLGIQLFPLQTNFLGGGMQNYISNPYLWSWANFDGEHYLAIARDGYKPLTYFFFPLYPVLIIQIARFMGGSFVAYMYSGLVISHISIFVGLVGLIKIIKLDYKEKVANLALLLLLIFPTSFYFVSIYTESLFFMLSVWSIYFAKTDRWWLAGIFGAFSTATRIFGLALIPALVFEYYKKKKKIVWPGKSFWWVALIPAGLIFYMNYLYKNTGDALAFFHNISIFGEQRSGDLILFPQVFYRYLFKILPALNFDYFPIVFTTFLEIVLAAIFLFFIGLMFYKKMWTYAVYSISIFILSSLSGSFSSFPRYALSIFPVFIMLSLWIGNLNKVLRLVTLTLILTALAVSTMLFSRGYWVS